MEHDKHHELLKPLREIVLGLGEWVVDKVIPQDVFDDFAQGGASQMLDEALDGQNKPR